IEELSKKHGVSMAQISLAWVLSKDSGLLSWPVARDRLIWARLCIAVSAPIVGTTSLEKLKDLISALDVKLFDEDIKYLEDAYKTVPVIGHS
ncbi:hypothetical protein HETIRDRAFT_313824, partial [Heterobasidion irregulare TC 32-1]